MPAGLGLAAVVAIVVNLATAAADAQWSLLGSQVAGSIDRPVWSLAVSPATPAVLLEATQGRGVLRSIDGGASWTRTLQDDESAWVVRFDPNQPGVAYAGTPTQGVFRSTDAGKTWTRSDAGLDPDVRALDVAQGIVLAGTAHGVFYSSDAAASWHLLGLQSLDISAVAIMQDGPTLTVFAGADNGTAGGYLWSASGITASFGIVHGNFPGDATVAALAVGPPPSGSTGHSLYAGTSEGLYHSDDSGTTWTQAAGLPQSDVNALAVNPASGDQIYIGSDGDQGQGGVFRSLDHGNTWSPLNATGFPKRPRVTALALQPATALQVLATTWNPNTNEIGLYGFPDSAAATTGGVSPSPATSARPTVLSTPHHQTSSQPAQSSSGIDFASAWRNVGIGAGVVVILAAVLMFRRWRMRREDLQTYRR